MEDCFANDYDAKYEETQHADVSTDETELDVTVHPVVELPIPYGIETKDNEIIFLDPSIGEGKRILSDKSSSVPLLFSILRQFIKPVCHNIGLIVDEMLKKGVSINDIDATTGMSILHYAVRAAALSEKRGLVIVKRLLSNGADPRQRCLFSGMNALHIAVYFDIVSVVKLLLKPCDLWPLVDVNSLCDGFNFGTSLHIAATCVSYKVHEILLQRGAKPSIRDDSDRLPVQCLPTNFTSEEEHKQAKHMKNLLLKYSDDPEAKSLESPRADDFTIGSKVFISYNQTNNPDGSVKVVKKTGTLRFIGKLPKSSDTWAGVELDTPDGQNSGDIGGKVYFKCQKKHGVFVRLAMVQSLESRKKSNKTSKKKASKCNFKIDDRVLVAGTMEGVVRFIGETQFASGVWCGVELDTAGPGRNNGSVGDVSYFVCPPAKGVFSPPSKLELIVNESVHFSPDTSESTGESGGSRKNSPRPATGRQTTRRISNSSFPLSARTRKLRFDESANHRHHRRPETSLSLKKESRSEEDRSYLHPGMRVDVVGTERSGIIKFVGVTEFAAGVWVGLDLGAPQGRNDGSVRGKRYFRCLPLHGLMVKLNKVSCKGVSGESLVPPDLKDSLPRK